MDLIFLCVSLLCRKRFQLFSVLVYFFFFYYFISWVWKWIGCVIWQLLWFIFILNSLQFVSIFLSIFEKPKSGSLIPICCLFLRVKSWKLEKRFNFWSPIRLQIIGAIGGVVFDFDYFVFSPLFFQKYKIDLWTMLFWCNFW